MNKVEQLNKITHLSSIIVFFAKLACWLLPLYTLIYWLAFNYLPQDFKSITHLHYLHHPQANILWQTQILGALVSFMPVLALVYLLSKLNHLFSEYKSHHIFTQQNSKFYKQLGLGCIWLLVLTKLSDILMSPILSFNNPAGQRVISVGVGFEDIQLLVMAFIIIVIGHIMQIAQNLEAEQALIV